MHADKNRGVSCTHAGVWAASNRDGVLTNAGGTDTAFGDTEHGGGREADAGSGEHAGGGESNAPSQISERRQAHYVCNLPDSYCCRCCR